MFKARQAVLEKGRERTQGRVSERVVEAEKGHEMALRERREKKMIGPSRYGVSA